ncbi:uncharacterized protein LOC102549940 [Rattus norvegicus]|uniref:uncharacterized protein LOC102549940 n=1 Tax=Rattus norvegicus TaxID=10116 RepID=UPI0003D0B798|nr:uncharacterized protein LOC102549940 [Rattus norvegicus]XP_006230207.1 uncharacterized protein LOC102549940 [Rattus norvegicus]XP_006230208.1 uncharacterized protein LOC102549940 [Rattus norvegicus]XP_006230209.1 uncharacterized protein LOC102549940 [Rattus norvegicus]|eukprot:XP_006230205.1 PREDICTED: uncharacterized protein LOC102549940 [Rattus norvegicus]
MMTTKNIFPASKSVTSNQLQVFSEAFNPTTKSSKTNKSKRSVQETKDPVRNLSKQLPENYDFVSESTNSYHLGLRPLTPRKLLAQELPTFAPIPKATKTCVPKDSMAMPQLIDEAYESIKNDSPALYPLRNASTVSVTKAPSSEDFIQKTPSADTMMVPSADTTKTPSADTTKLPSADTVEVPSSLTSKRLSAMAMKPKTKTQDINQKQQDNEKSCFSLDLMFVNPNQLTLGIQRVPIPEATEATVPGTQVMS